MTFQARGDFLTFPAFLIRWGHRRNCYAQDILDTFISDLILAILSYTAQIERDLMLQWQTEGKKLGRPKKDLPTDFDERYLSWRRGSDQRRGAARCNIALGVLYR